MIITQIMKYGICFISTKKILSNRKYDFNYKQTELYLYFKHLITFTFNTFRFVIFSRNVRLLIKSSLIILDFIFNSEFTKIIK